MTYSTSEAAKKLNLSKDTLLYYEKEGLLPPIQRNISGHRIYSETDMEWIFLIRSLRDTDMPIAKVKHYVSLLIKKGGESISERREILTNHKIFLSEKIALYQNLFKLIEKKITFYNDVLNNENPDTIKCMDYITEWEQFRSKLKGVKHG